MAKKARLVVSICVVAMGLPLSLVLCGAEESATGRNGLSRAFQNAQPVGGGVYSISGKQNASVAKGKSTEEQLKELGDDEILVCIDGSDKLKWGLLRHHVEALCSGIDRPDMKVEGTSALKSIAYQSRLRKLLKEYIEYAVFAVEARRCGITVPKETFDAYRAKARAGYAKMGEAGKALLRLMDEGECFYEHNLTNALYCQAYKNQVLSPLTQAEGNDAERIADMVRYANAAASATNLHNRVLIADILGKIKKGGMDFGDAAEKWSDSESSATRGVMMDGLDEHPERFAPGNLPEEVEAAIHGLKEGEISGVIETPLDWRIVRLLKRNAAQDDEEPTVEIAEILLEKRMLEPELTPAQSKAKVESIKMKAALKIKFRELLDTVKIDSRIPLWEPADRNKRPVKVRRIK